MTTRWCVLAMITQNTVNWSINFASQTVETSYSFDINCNVKHVFGTSFHPRKPKWQWNITIFNRRYIFRLLFFHCHVGFRVCIIIMYYVILYHIILYYIILYRYTLHILATVGPWLFLSSNLQTSFCWLGCEPSVCFKKTTRRPRNLLARRINTWPRGASEATNGMENQRQQGPLPWKINGWNLKIT